VNKSKPSNVKGIYLRKVSVSSTMGPGVRWMWRASAPAEARSIELIRE